VIREEVEYDRTDRFQGETQRIMIQAVPTDRITGDIQLLPAEPSGKRA
jgi:hypothetical protein